MNNHMLRYCQHTGCTTLIPTSQRHCPEHKRLKAQRYGRAHRAARQAVLERDHHRCHYCGQPAKPGEVLDAAHLQPTSHQPLQAGWQPSAMVAAHRRCHNKNAPHLVA